MKGAKHFNKPDGNARPQGKLATKEEVQTMTTPEQIALIETIAEKVTSNPAENARLIQTLLHLIELGSTVVASLAILTTAEVFKDIVPLYQINKEALEERLKEVISKDERGLLNQELIIIELYERYMRTIFAQKQHLEKIADDEKEPLKKKKLREALEQFEVVVLKALTEVAKELYHFNFASEIIKFVLRFAFKRHEGIQKLICAFLEFFMKSQNPSTYFFKLLILEHFGKLIKQRKFVNMFPEPVFAQLTEVYAEGSGEQDKAERELDNLQDRIDNLRERKKKNKLSKAGEKQLKDLEDQKKRRNERRKRKGLDDPRLQKELKANLVLSEATVDPAKVNRLVAWE